MLGWAVAAVLAGIFVGGGFQSADTKLGVVDFASVVQKSEYYVANKKQLDTMQAAREGLLEFLFTYKVATADQAQKLRDLFVKDNPSPADVQARDALKAEIQNADKDAQALAPKVNPTPDETARMQDYATRRRATDGLLVRWKDQFEQELRAKLETVQSTALDRAKQSVSEVGKAGGYTIVYRYPDVAPYGANDITDASLKAMNTKK